MKKFKMMGLLFLLIPFVGIGYAGLNTTMKVNGTSKINNATWDIHFENIREVEGSVTARKTASINSLTGINFDITLTNPGDYYQFDVDIVNDGSIDAMISNISKLPNLSDEQMKYVEYKVFYKDTVNPEIKIKDSLGAGERKTLIVLIKYRDDLNPEDLPEDTDVLKLTYDITYVQDDGNSNRAELAL